MKKHWRKFVDRLPHNRIRELRGDQNLTLMKLAELLGVHWTTVARHQRGIGTSPAMMQEYANIFGVKIIELYVNPDSVPGSHSAAAQ